MSCGGNSCGCGCGGSSWGGDAPAPYQSPITHWRQASGQVVPGQGVEAAPGPGQPGRGPADAAAAAGHLPWWVWIVVGLVALRLLKKGPA